MNTTEEKLVLGYNIVGDGANSRIEKIRTVFRNIGQLLDEVRVTLTVNIPITKDASTFVSIILQYCCQLERVVLSGGVLTCNALSCTARLPTIHNFVFKKTMIDSTGLTQLPVYLLPLEFFNWIAVQSCLLQKTLTKKFF